MAKKLAKAQKGIPYKSTKTARDMMEASDIRDRRIAEGKRKPLSGTERMLINTPLDSTYNEALRGKMSMQNKLAKKQMGGSTITPKSKSLDPIKKVNTFKKGDVLSDGVYRSNPADKIKAANTMKDWAKKEKQVTNPKNRPAGSAIKPLKKGGSTKRK